jgi:L-amino acid N-acyltransferase YncA
MEIKKMNPEHWESVKSIYEEGILTGNATAETSAPNWESWNSAHLEQCRFVIEDNQRILAWAALSPVSGRCVYGGVAEISVYVSAEARGKGLGKKILNALVESSEKEKLWTLQAGIFPENIASVKIHEQCGFRLIGKREKIIKLNGVWRDTLLFEKRSKSVGV